MHCFDLTRFFFVITFLTTFFFTQKLFTFQVSLPTYGLTLVAKLSHSVCLTIGKLCKVILWMKLANLSQSARTLKRGKDLKWACLTWATIWTNYKIEDNHTKNHNEEEFFPFLQQQQVISSFYIFNVQVDFLISKYLDDFCVSL